METPSSAVRVRVDGQGRVVLPLWLRRELVSTPGEVLLRRTEEGVLLTKATEETEVEQAADGLPVLRHGRAVSNDEVVESIHRERAGR